MASTSIQKVLDFCCSTEEPGEALGVVIRPRVTIIVSEARSGFEEDLFG